MEKKSYKCSNVGATSNRSDNTSRQDLLKWINDLLSHQRISDMMRNFKVQKVESLCSGVVYCEILNMLFPECLPMKRVKMDATQEHEYMSNLKLLQLGFKKIGCEKDVPIEKLIKGRFLENFEFLQWFKRFVERNEDMKFLDPPTCSDEASVKRLDEYIKSTKRKMAPPRSSLIGSCGQAPRLRQAEGQAARLRQAEHLKSEINELKTKADVISQEREFYFSKLRNIEILCTNELPLDKETLVEQILAELYATEEASDPADVGPNEGKDEKEEEEGK